MRPPCITTDPEGFHLAIIAKVAALYLGLGGRMEDGKPEYPSDLYAAFAAKGLGLPDFALFWDFGRRFATKICNHPAPHHYF